MGFELFFQKIFEYLDQIFPFVRIDQFEHGILMRNGKKKKNLKKGIHFLPLKIFFIDTVLTVLKEKDTFTENVNVTTLDGKTVSITVVVEFSVDEDKDADNYLLNTNDSPSNARDITGGIATELLCECEWEEIKKKTIKTQIKNRLKEPLEELGMNVRKVLFKNVLVTRALTIFNN